VDIIFRNLGTVLPKQILNLYTNYTLHWNKTVSSNLNRSTRTYFQIHVGIALEVFITS